MKWCARACGVSRKYKQEAAAGRSPSRVRPVRAGAAVQCTCKAARPSHVVVVHCPWPVPGRSAGVALSTPPRMEWNAAHASRARVSCIFIGMAKFLRWCLHICMCVLHIYGSATTETKMAYWPRACCRIGTLWRGVVVGARIPAFKGEILLFFSRRVERGRDGLASHQACITGKAEVVFMAV